LPGSTDDIGTWTQPLGAVNIAVEALVLAAVVGALRGARRR
jgi:hypothetical protein